MDLVPHMFLLDDIKQATKPHVDGLCSTGENAGQNELSWELLIRLSW
jgi:hypothetical protein